MPCAAASVSAFSIAASITALSIEYFSGMGLTGGMLVGNPIPEKYSMDKAVIDAAIEKALTDAAAQGIHGKETLRRLRISPACFTGFFDTAIRRTKGSGDLFSR